MDVTFASTNPKQKRIGPIMCGNKELVLQDGYITTTDKDEIKSLLQHSFYKRGYYKMITDAEHVGAYLENDEEPDYIDEDYLENVSNDAILKIGKLVGTHNEIPALIKAELRNEPVTSAIAEIVKADKAKAEKKAEKNEPKDETDKEPKAKKKKKKAKGD